MQHQLVLVVLSILYFTIHVQSADNATIIAVVNVTIPVPGTVKVFVNQTTLPSTTSTTTTTTAAAFVSQKAVGPSYVEPPPHPLGYCIRSRLMCSKIRRCCSGPCNVNNMKCP